MKESRMAKSVSGRLVVVSLLAAGFLLAGNAPSWADRDGRHDSRDAHDDTANLHVERRATAEPADDPRRTVRGCRRQIADPRPLLAGVSLA